MERQGTPRIGPGSLEFLGDGVQVAERIADLASRTLLFSQIERSALIKLGAYMQLYRAQPGAAVVREDEPGDTLLLLLEGRIEVYKRDLRRREKLIATITPGETVGEMAVVDGEPRFATCVATEPSLLAALSREGLARLIDEEPRLGAKILVQLLEEMGQRLRMTCGILVNYLKVS